MITILGNSEFATGMRFCGIKSSHVIRSRSEALSVIRGLEKDAFIVANVSIIEMVPELKEFKNLVSIPDSPKDFGKIDDLKEVIKSAVGIEFDLE